MKCKHATHGSNTEGSRSESRDDPCSFCRSCVDAAGGSPHGRMVEEATRVRERDNDRSEVKRRNVSGAGEMEGREGQQRRRGGGEGRRAKGGGETRGTEEIVPPDKRGRNMDTYNGTNTTIMRKMVATQKF